MVTGLKRISGRKIILALAAAFSFFAVTVVDRLIYFRKISWSASAMKGIAAVYSGCENRIEIKGAVTGVRLIQTCDPRVADKMADEFTRHAKEITVFPQSCFHKPVIAWGPELHYWAEDWMPLAPRPGRYVLFEDKRWNFVPVHEFILFRYP